MEWTVAVCYNCTIVKLDRELSIVNFGSPVSADKRTLSARQPVVEKPYYIFKQFKPRSEGSIGALWLRSELFENVNRFFGTSKIIAKNPQNQALGWSKVQYGNRPSFHLGVKELKDRKHTANLFSVYLSWIKHFDNVDIALIW